MTMLEQIQKFVRRLPRLGFLPVVYVLGYAGLRGELLDIVSWFLVVPASTMQTLTVGYWTICGIHYAVLLLAIGFEKLTQRPAWFSLARTRIAMIPALAIGSMISLGLIWGRSVSAPVSSRQLSNEAEVAIRRMEELMLSSIEKVSERAHGQLDIIDSSIRETKGGPTEYEKVLLTLGGKRTKDKPIRWSDLILLELSSAGGEPTYLSVPKFKDLPQWVLKASRPLDTKTEVWVQPTELGCIVVTQRKNSSYGRLVSIALWSEGNFLQSTLPLWKDQPQESRYGLYIICGDDRIVYSTEVSEYGERLSGQLTVPVFEGRLREIRDMRGVRYVYERRGKDPRLHRLKMRIGLKPQRSADITTAMFNTVVLLILIALVGLYITAESKQPQATAKTKSIPSKAIQGN